MRPADIDRGEPSKIKAVNIVMDAMDDWFWAIESGTAGKRSPDPSGQRYSKAQVDAFIKQIDNEFEYEIDNYSSYHQARGMSIVPDFNRLKGQSREAFMQTMKKVKGDAFEKYGYGNGETSWE
jgi:hypothetical protein